VVERQRYQPLVLPFDSLESAHCVGLACTCLTINEQGCVVALEHVFYDGHAGRSEYLLLSGSLIEDGVEVKLMDFIILVVEGHALI
jgi:hypothetical protein